MDIFQKLGEFFAIVDVQDDLIGAGGVVVGDHVFDGDLAVIAAGLGGGIEGLGGFADDPHFLGRQLHMNRKFLDHWRTAEPVFQFAHRGFQAVHHLDHVGRNVDRLDGIDERPLDPLFDPPGGIGAEAATGIGIEPFDRADQADVAFLDQILERQTPVHIVFGDVDDQPKIRADHPLAGLKIALLHTAGKFALILGRQ